MDTSQNFRWYSLVINIPHCTSLLTLIKAQLLKEGMGGHGDEAREYNNNKVQENGDALKDRASDDEEIMINADQVYWGDLVDGSYFHG